MRKATLFTTSILTLAALTLAGTGCHKNSATDLAAASAAADATCACLKVPTDKAIACVDANSKAFDAAWKKLDVKDPAANPIWEMNTKCSRQVSDAVEQMQRFANGSPR